jgi:MoaA/NifB/PqqE/SkfB family radical SAM enzyme
MKKFVCSNPWTHFEVNNPNGDVTMCCDNNTLLGNVNEGTIEEIWNGKPYINIRRIMREDGAHSICPHTCPVLHGGKKYQELNWYDELDQKGAAFKNAKLNELEQSEGKDQLKSLPRWMRFTYSYHCNLDCYHCYQRDEAIENKKLPEKFMDEIRSHADIYQVLFPFGGEPFLFKPVTQLVADLETDPGCRFFFITNGTLITDQILQNLERRKVGMMAVSLDAASTESFDILRVRGRSADWATVMDTLRRLSDLKKRKGFHMTVSMTVNRVNYHEIGPFIDLAHSYDAEPLVLLVTNPKQTLAFQEEFLVFSDEQFFAMEAQIKSGLEKVRGRKEREAEILLLQLREQLSHHRSGDNALWRYKMRSVMRNLFNNLPEPLQQKCRSLLTLVRQ